MQPSVPCHKIIFKPYVKVEPNFMLTEEFNNISKQQQTSPGKQQICSFKFGSNFTFNKIITHRVESNATRR